MSVAIVRPTVAETLVRGVVAQMVKLENVRKDPRARKLVGQTIRSLVEQMTANGFLKTEIERAACIDIIESFELTSS